jgi:Fe-S oxidoreductase
MSGAAPERATPDLDAQTRVLELCTYCPKMCRLACPVAETTGRESVTPWALMGLANYVRRGQIDLTPEIARSFYDCTNCLACQTYCLHGNDVPAALGAARRRAVESGKAPPAVTEILDRYRRNGSMFGAADRETLRDAVPADRVDPAAPAALFLGCHSASDPRAVEETTAALAAVGLRFALPGSDLRCCGAPLRDLGFEEAFTEVAKANQAVLSRHERVICDTSICARTFERDYPRVGAALSGTVEDIVTPLDEALGEGKLSSVKKLRQRAVYHDPCHLGRHGKVYDAPRRVAAALLEQPLGELPWSRDRAACCGAGGGFPFVDPRTARELARAVTALAKQEGYALIVTASGECAAMLAEGNAGIPARTLASLVAQGLEKGAATPGR